MSRAKMILVWPLRAPVRAAAAAARWLRRSVEDLALVGGLATVSGGISAIYWPAGMIAAGFFLAYGAWRSAAAASVAPTAPAAVERWYSGEEAGD